MTEMQFPLDPHMAEMIRPQLNRRNPHELHWRRTPPEWHGCIDKSHGYLYSHMADETCCMQCGAIPCPFDHEEHKRLKLADLEFVKELAKERRELKEKVANLLRKIQGMDDKQMELKAQKILLVEQVRHYEYLQKEWERQKMLMEGEIERLKKLNADNLYKLQNYKKDQEKLRILSKRVQDLEKENTSLKEENRKYRQMISKQADDLQKLETHNKELVKQTEESQVHIRSLRVQLDETYEDLCKTRNALMDETLRTQQLKDELLDMQAELAKRTQEFNERDAAHEARIKQLLEELARLRSKLKDSETDNKELRQEIEELLAEIQRLKSKLSSDTRFRRFVDIKRECSQLKEKNETLIVKVYEHEKDCQPLPLMKASGRIKSAGICRRREHSPGHVHRPGSSCGALSSKPMLSRPKSARTPIIIDHNLDEDKNDSSDGNI